MRLVLEREFNAGVYAEYAYVGDGGVLLAGSGVLWWPWGAVFEDIWLQLGAGALIRPEGITLAGKHVYIPHEVGARLIVVRAPIFGNAPAVSVEHPGPSYLLTGLYQGHLIRHENGFVSGLDPDTLKVAWRAAAGTGRKLVVANHLVHLQQGVETFEGPESGTWTNWPVSTPWGPPTFLTGETRDDQLAIVGEIYEKKIRFAGTWDFATHDCPGWVRMNFTEWLAGTTPDPTTFLTSDQNCAYLRSARSEDPVWAFPTGKYSEPRSAWTPAGIVVISDNVGPRMSRLWLLDPATGEVLEQHDLKDGAASRAFWAGEYVIVENGSSFRAFRIVTT